MKTREILDRCYAERSIEENTKQYFDIMIALSERHLKSLPKAEVIEIGCATGVFSSLLHMRHKNIEVLGVDISEILINKAHQNYPAINFIVGDISNRKTLPQKKYDAAFMIALHSHFEDLDEWFPNFVDLIKKGGQGYIFGLFNPYDVDVIIKVRHRKLTPKWLCGWSMFSRFEVSNYLMNKGIKFSFHDYVQTKIKKPVLDDPLVSWTQDLLSGQRILINGTGLIHHFAALKISVN